MDKLKEIKIAVGYTLNNKRITMFPASLNDLAKVTVEYKTLKGWECDITKMTHYKELPENAKTYIKFISDYLEIPITYVGVGPDRSAMITIN